jgi:O-antigen/teichoic acid export membrane protein
MIGTFKLAFSRVLAGSRIAKALSWTAASTALVSVILFVRSVLLARMLSPADYGIMGLAMLVTAAISTLSSVGLGASLIARNFQDEGEASRVLNTVWTAEVIKQAGVSAILLACAYPCAMYFGNQRVFPVLLIISLAPGIQGFTNIGMVLLQKSVSFRNVALHRISAELLTSCGVLVTAFFTRSVFALAIGQLLGAIISVCLSFYFHPYRPRFRFEWSDLRGSISFSRSILAISVLTYLTTQFDNLVVGRHLGATVLGAYLLAYRLASLPSDLIGDVLGTVMFPVFADARVSGQDGQLVLQRAVISSLAVLSCVLLSLRILSSDVIHLLYGKKWETAAPMLALLTFIGLFRGAARTFTPFLLGANRADLDAKAKFLETSIFVPAVLVLVPRLGVSGAAYAGIMTYLLAAILRLGFTVRLLLHGWKLFVRVLAFVLLTAIGYGAVLWSPIIHAHSVFAAGLMCLLITVGFVAVQYRPAPIWVTLQGFWYRTPRVGAGVEIDPD